MTKTYSHMARDKNAVGTVLKGKGKPMVDPSIEALLARHRGTSLDRPDSVFMSDDKDFRTQGINADEGFIHEVEPIGHVDQRDNRWIGELELRLKAPTNPAAKILQRHADLSEDEIAKRYWAGTASSAPRWEYVAKEAKVVSVEATKALVRPPRTVI